MEKIMNDNDSKAFLKEMARVCPDYKENFGAVSNLIVLLMEELQKERKGRKRGEKFEKIVEEIKNISPSAILNFVENCDDIHMKKSMRRKIEDELDDLWREIIYLKYNFRCEICGEKLEPNSWNCHAHHIIPRGNFNVRWDEDNGSLLCNYNHNHAPNAPHHDNEKYLEWLKNHRPKGHYEKLLRKSGEKGGANKLWLTELIQLRNRLRERRLELQAIQSTYMKKSYLLKMK